VAELVVGSDEMDGVNQVNGSMGFGPGVDETLTGYGFARLEAAARVVEDDLTVACESDADDEMAVVEVGFTFEDGIRDGSDDGNAGEEPRFEFGKESETGDVRAEAVEAAGERGVEGPVAGARPVWVMNGFGDLGDVDKEIGAMQVAGPEVKDHG
jgi:hypothetical protein